MMERFYATLDADGRDIREGAHIVAFDSREQAAAYLYATFEDSLDEDEIISIESGDFGDYWIKIGDIDLADTTPFANDEVICQHPGSHPGGNRYWLTPRPDILVAVIESL